MKSFLSRHIHNVIDFDHLALDKSSNHKCVSITGNQLNILGCITTKLSFVHSKYSYSGNFLVSDNIPYECVIGWDFILSNQLSLKSDIGGDYLLCGRHGVTHIYHHKETEITSRVGIIDQHPTPVRDRVLYESEHSCCAGVVLTESVVIPPRSEMMLGGKVSSKITSTVGMVGPSPRATKERDGFHIAHAIVTPGEGRVVPLRAMNMSNHKIELSVGENLAEFSPLIESCTKKPDAPRGNVVAGVFQQTSDDFAKQVDTALDSGLSSSDKQYVLELLYEFRDVFDDSLGHTTTYSHRIDTGNSTPIKQRPRRLPYAHREEAKKQITSMLEQGVIRPSTSAWSSPIVLVTKKSGELRFCVDFRKLNSVTTGHAHPLPRMDDIFDSLGNSQYFSTLDLRQGYWQIEVCEEDKHKTAFVTHNGLYEFNRMPFGLSTAPSTFQKTMEIVLSGLTYETCLCYLDDVIVFGQDIRAHCSRLKTVLCRLRDHNLRARLSKCKFAAREVHYLGHIISQDGVKPDPGKIAAVNDLPPPNSVKSVRSFLGLSGYYRKFIPSFATISAPLVRLTEKNVQFKWTDECEGAFRTLQRLLCSAPVLCFPNWEHKFILQTDASDFGVGAILSQVDHNGIERVVSYASKVLSARERKYSATEKEAYAIIFGVRHFRVYLLGRPFRIVTDHSALRWMHTMEPKGRVARWLMDLQEFQFIVEHRAGRLHNNADALSRLVPEPENHSVASASVRDPAPLRKIVITKKEINLSSGRKVIITFQSSTKQPDDASGTTKVRHNLTDLSQTFANSTSCTTRVNPTINFKDAQQNDPQLSKIIEWKLNGVEKPDYKAFGKGSYKALLKYYDRLFIHNGILVRAVGTRQPHPDYVIVVPENLQNEVLDALHCGPFSGHLGITRTEERIRTRFYWPGIRTAVENFVRTCQECSKNTSPGRQNRAPLGTLSVGEPFTFWAMDYMGPLPETCRGNKHLLVAVDHFTKWCEVFPTKDQKASTVAPLLISKIFSRFGPPVVLHSDQGRNFESVLMHEICDAMGITKTRTTAYHPQGDGQTERQNRTLQKMLSSFVSSRQDDWDLWVDSVVYAYNTSLHESLGLSPYEVVFGRTPRLPFELEVGIPLSNPATHSEYLHSARSVFRDVRSVARENLKQATEKRMKQSRADQKDNPWQPFRVGQPVMLKRPKSWKFGSKWVGPFEVKSRMGVNYRIESKVGKQRVVHHDHLKHSYVPFREGEVVCPGREFDDFQFVECAPPTTPQDNPRLRPRRLRQNIRPPVRYGYNS